MSDTDVSKALKAWAGALGDAYVKTDPASLDVVEKTTFKSTNRILGILAPANRDEVQACLRIANEFRVPVYPTSRGRQWGLGSRVPVRDSSVLLDLGRMNRIVDFDEELSFVTVEPGVSFLDVATFLRARGSKLHISSIGGTMHASVIGNTLERGHGGARYHDRAKHVTNFEVVLPSGEWMKTGMGRFANARAGAAHPWGVGPAAEGLFLQSNLGVVTQMTVWLNPYPERNDTMLFKVSSEKVGLVVDRMRTLPVDENFAWALKKNPDFGASAIAAAKRGETVAEPWEGLVNFTTASEQMSDLTLERVVRLFEGVVTEVDVLEIPNEVFHPQEERVLGIYDALGRPRPADKIADFDRDGCGIRWCCPSLPARSRDVDHYVRTVDRIAGDHGLDPTNILLPMSPRSIDGIVAIVFDRNDPAAEENAAHCYRELNRFFLEDGYMPYRLGIEDMGLLPRPEGGFNEFIGTLKRALDPNDILAPGRYDFRS